MNIKNIFSNLIKYTPENDYSFSLLEKPYEQDENKEDNFSEDKTKIFSSVNVNLDYVKSKYNTLINSDIVLREFTLNARGKQFHAFILYFDGMINTQMLNDFVLEPLMMRNKNNLFEGDQNKVVYESVTNNVTIRKVKKFNLSDYLKNCLIPQNDLKEVKTFSECFSGINSGNCALFVDTLPIAFNIEIKGFQQRSVEKPTNEIVIKGPHEAFVENIRTNTSLLRRIINNENLTIENISFPENIEKALDERATLGILGDKMGVYAQKKAADALGDAAKNSGAAGSFIGMGIGQTMGGAMSGVFSNIQNAKDEPKQQSGGKFCPNCGAAVGAGAKFCPECGTKLTD